jgi:uncharacterized protein YbcV (DUF1398 family)
MTTRSVSQSIHNVWAQVHSPASLSFSQVVTQLLALGVTRYHINYIASTATAYFTNPQTGVVDVDVAGMPSHMPKPSIGTTAWNEKGVRTALRRVQGGETSYPEFAKECIEAGVTDYFTCLEGKRVVYRGAFGDLIVEWFADAKPKPEESR